MIKIGIIGADKPDAGELLRLLLNHPEVEVETLFSPSLSGRQVSSCHHGFIGERIMNFTDRLDLSKLDVIFIADDSQTGRNVIEKALEMEQLRVIDLSPGRFDDWSTMEMEYGLSEINRKPLVRGARMAIVPTPIASLALIALHPLATNLLLPSEISLTVVVPEGVAKLIEQKKVSEEIIRQLKHAQNSFEGNINMRIIPEGSGRTMKVIATMVCPLAIAEIDRIFNSIYDDHSFAFTSLSKVGGEEVEGTQKCIVSFCKPGAGLIEIEIVGDCHMWGGAGDALHAMNLLFALHEKVGLNLKTSRFGDYREASSRQTSWFA